MANHKSAEKRARQTVKRTERNRFYRTRLKNMTRAVREAVDAKNIEAAEAALKVANQSFHSFLSKGFFKKETSSRRVSRLAKLVNSLKTAA